MGCTFSTNSMSFEEVEQMAQQKRRHNLYIGLHIWDGFAYPELFVREDNRAATFVAAALVLVLLPIILLYFALQRAVLWLRDPAYRSGGKYATSIGPLCWLESLCDHIFDGSKPTYSSVDDLRSDGWGRESDDVASEMVVVDDFHEDPDRARRAALRSPMSLYEKGWFTSVGGVVGDSNTLDDDDDLVGFDVDAVRRKFEAALGRDVDGTEFETEVESKSNWNGSFHVKYSENLLSTSACAIHTHADLGKDAYAAIVYLDDDCPNPKTSGTSFWAHRHYKGDGCGMVSEGGGSAEKQIFDARLHRFRCVLRVPSRYNRAVIAPAAVLHRGERGYGATRETARLFQTFFFRAVPCLPPAASPTVVEAEGVVPIPAVHEQTLSTV